MGFINEDVRPSGQLSFVLDHNGTNVTFAFDVFANTDTAIPADIETAVQALADLIDGSADFDLSGSLNRNYAGSDQVTPT